MKKLAILAVAVFAMSLGVANAAETPVGTATVNEGGYILVLDGNADNPDPVDGFISVSEDGTICADDNGTADDGDDTNGKESTDPTCSSDI